MTGPIARTPATALGSAPASFGIAAACQSTALRPAVLVMTTLDDLNGTDGDSAAGLKPPPATKLITLRVPCFLISVTPMIEPTLHTATQILPRFVR